MYKGYFSEKQKQIGVNLLHNIGSIIWLDEFGNEVKVTVITNLEDKAPTYFDDFVYKGIVVKCIKLLPIKTNDSI